MDSKYVMNLGTGEHRNLKMHPGRAFQDAEYRKDYFESKR